jgi:hypothetical protein
LERRLLVSGLEQCPGCHPERLAAIILTIAMTNLFNRVNVTIRQRAGKP